jgi:hypothetical protein
MRECHQVAHPLIPAMLGSVYMLASGRKVQICLMAAAGTGVSINRESCCSHSPPVPETESPLVQRAFLF